ncbi:MULTISPECIES: glycosyltransferase family 39 protein [unclassified Lentimicrobium]|uniref:ArnT family glycosyltransferase n=1 Tax=unclassified Lentimicrobium TaxID=2677434 RepID=UPI00155174C5|nr:MULTISPECIES: glycosyltransferase family 39 protein [unclassified Lentimicrobium]NPD46094.1 phospholipid carrier-dependent glycosyltransferase [Lentimicrobium sp. S6]NPD86287.1 phospholipid carrier-dependent glycosyltransferase [Lentimicrobium sp. L6]
MNIIIPKKYQALAWLILISSIVRIILAYWIEMGNDEVYYYTYAAYPGWSHFDHPPMIGWVIQLFSLGSYLQSTLLMRASSIFFAAVNTWLIFELGCRIKNEKTGWYAAILYTSSLYTSLIAGVFIMPDTPQLFFWIFSLFLMIDILPDKDMVNSNKRRFLLLGLTIGLGMISKYTTLFLWPGIFLYIQFYNRNWFKSLSLYAAGIISVIVFSPVLIWNYMHHFISFTFHGDRVGMGSQGIRFDFIGTEILGEFLYQNPVVFLLVWIAVIYGWKNKGSFLEKKKFHFLLFQSLPMIGVFLFVSLFRKTLPHWTGPAYVSLLLVGAAFLSRKNNGELKMFPPIIKASIISIFFILIIGGAQINYGLFDLKKIIGNDISLDMYGWRQMKQPFKEIKEKAERTKMIQKDAPLVSFRWFPAAHLDYYVALPNNTHVLGWGSLERIHKYAWMNEKRGGYQLGMDAWFINMDNDLFSMDFTKDHFETVIPYDTISISRSGKMVKQAYVYILKDLKKIPYNDFQAFMKKNEEIKK